MTNATKRWTASRAGEILDAADGERSDQAYATATGVTLGRIGWWRARLARPRLRASKRAASAKVAFVEVKSPPPSAATTVEVLLSNGRQFRVSERIEPALVGRLADALEKSC